MAQKPKPKTLGEFQVPSISGDDLKVFFDAHFSEHALADFGGTFMNPQAQEAPEGEPKPEEVEEWEEEDDLGYYPDGVKRTLTDEQVKMFRHSEIQAILRTRQKALEKAAEAAADGSKSNSDPSSVNSPDPKFWSKKTKGKKRKTVQREPKPDLRKRTWDVVDKGLDTLEYD